MSNSELEQVGVTEMEGLPIYKYRGYEVYPDGGTPSMWAIYEEGVLHPGGLRLSSPHNDRGRFGDLEDAKARIDEEIAKLEGEALDQEIGVKPQFMITDAESADWVLGKLADLDARKARVKAQYAKMLAQIDAQEKRLQFRFGAELERFLTEELERSGSRKKSMELFNGTLALRKVGETIVVEDLTAVLDYLIDNQLGEKFDGDPEALYRVESKLALNTAKAKAYLLDQVRQGGEIPEGCRFVPEHQEFSVRFPKPKTPSD